MKQNASDLFWMTQTLLNEAINKMAGSGIFYLLGSERKQWKIKDLAMVILSNKEFKNLNILTSSITYGLNILYCITLYKMFDCKF